MESTRQRTARTVIVVGYAIMFGGTLTTDAWQIERGYFQQSWRTDINMFSLMFASLATIVAWWFLTRIVATTPHQTSLIRKAYVALTIQALLLSCGLAPFLVALPALVWQNVFLWGYAAGNLVITIGFFLMVTTYRPAFVTTVDAVAVDL